MKRNRKPRYTASLKDIFSLYVRHSRDVWKLIPFQFALVCIDGLLHSRIPTVIKYVIEGVTGNPEYFIKNKLLFVSVGVLCLSGLWYIVAASSHYLNSKISTTILIRIQVSLYTHLQKLGLDFYNRTHVGEITSRLTGDINQGVLQLYRTFSYLIWTLALLIPSCITMAKIDVRLFMFFILLIFMLVIMTRYIIPVLRSRQRDVQDQRGRINARMTEDVSSISLIKSYAQERLFTQEVSEECNVFLSKSLHTARIRILFSDFIAMFIVYVAPLSILCFGAFLTTSGLTVGELVAFYTYWTIISRHIRFLVNMFPELFTAFASLDRILEFFKETPLIKNLPDAKHFEIQKGEIEFKNVLFRYPVTDGDMVLNNVSFRAEAFKSLAIVGESGAGKSTITNLILRFYDPLEGSVMIDGQDISKIRQKDLRRQIGLVMQDTILFSGSIRQNMVFAMQGASDEEIIEALKQAEAWKFIEKMPDRLDTLLGERGVRLSGGQKQRISIARVFLKNPPIVIFDEATSALDTITEKQIQETMTKLFKNRTSIIIAHRLSTIINCDKILLLDKGRVQAMGRHADLISRSPEYSMLCKKQALFEGCLETAET